jgi:hypothetical protein
MDNQSLIERISGKFTGLTFYGSIGFLFATIVFVFLLCKKGPSKRRISASTKAIVRDQERERERSKSPPKIKKEASYLDSQTLADQLGDVTNESHLTPDDSHMEIDESEIDESGQTSSFHQPASESMHHVHQRRISRSIEVDVESPEFIEFFEQYKQENDANISNAKLAFIAKKLTKTEIGPRQKYKTVPFGGANVMFS